MSTSDAPLAPPDGGDSPVGSAALLQAIETRAHRCVQQLVAGLPPAAAARAAGAATDLEVLSALLHDAAYVPPRMDPRAAAAYARGRAAKQEMLQEEGGMLRGVELARALGISRQAVDKRREQGKLLGVLEGGIWLYPRWQFDQNWTRLEGFGEVQQELHEGGHSAWAQVVFFLSGETPQPGETPLEALRNNRVEAALEAARSYGVHGAK